MSNKKLIVLIEKMRAEWAEGYSPDQAKILYGLDNLLYAASGRMDKANQEIKKLMTAHANSHHRYCEIIAYGQCTCGQYLGSEEREIEKKYGHPAYTTKPCRKYG